MTTTFEEADTILFDGTENEIKDLQCACGGKIIYYRNKNNFTYACTKCKQIAFMRGISETPNCERFLGIGESNILDEILASALKK
ncbi:MAG: hypothetical protein LBP62_02345 [Clostridiales bacterium]|jgi:hypothetical protein|nr:hypothetical protein [Clostridiales bacterium]